MAFLVLSLKYVTEMCLLTRLTSCDLVCDPCRSLLGEAFHFVEEVNVLDSRDVTNLALLDRPDLGVTFTKLHCWRLTRFCKGVFLDADTLVGDLCDL